MSKLTNLSLCLTIGEANLELIFENSLVQRLVAYDCLVLAPKQYFWFHPMK